MMANLEVGYVRQQIADIHLFYLPLPGNQCLGASIGNWRLLLCNLFSLFSSWFSSFSFCVIFHKVLLCDSFSSFHDINSMQFYNLPPWSNISLYYINVDGLEHFFHRSIIVPPSREGITTLFMKGIHLPCSLFIPWSPLPSLPAANQPLRATIGNWHSLAACNKFSTAAQKCRC